MNIWQVIRLGIMLIGSLALNPVETADLSLKHFSATGSLETPWINGSFAGNFNTITVSMSIYDTKTNQTILLDQLNIIWYSIDCSGKKLAPFYNTTVIEIRRSPSESRSYAIKLAVQSKPKLNFSLDLAQSLSNPIAFGTRARPLGETNSTTVDAMGLQLATAIFALFFRLLFFRRKNQFTIPTSDLLP